MLDTTLSACVKNHKTPNEDHHSKRQKIDAVAESIATTKLTDVNTDCLERIFRHLNIDDLLSIVHTNKLFKNAADLVFNSKFRGVTFHCSDYRCSIKRGEKHMFITEVRKSLRLLRCFGHLITDLVIGFQHSHEYLIPYVVDYCAKSLRTIHFSRGNQIFDSLKKPFANVEIVKFEGCTNLQLHQLNALFPKMLRLLLDDFELPFASRSIELHFPHLEHLQLNVDRNDVTQFMQSNSKLRSLRVTWSYNSDAFENAAKCLQQLEYLAVIYRGLFCLQSSKSIPLTNLKTLLINFLDVYGRNVWNPMHKLPFVCEQLQELILDVGNFQFSNELVEFIMKHPTIQKLCIRSLHFGRTLNDAQLVKIARALPMLTLMNFEVIYISNDDAARFINSCNGLRTFRFFALDDYNIRELLGNLEQSWRLEAWKAHSVGKLRTVELERENMPTVALSNEIK